MEPLGVQLRRQRRRLGLSLDDMRKLTGISKPYLSLVETGKTKSPPSDEKLRKLELALKFPEGSLVARAHLAKTPADVRRVIGRLLTREGGAEGGGVRGDPGNLDEAYWSGALAAMVEARVGNVEVVGWEGVPVVNRVSAGYPQDFTDLGYPARVADEYVPSPVTGDRDRFAARVYGESMLPAYRDGDVVVFSPAAEPASGTDCFVRLEDGRTTFKRVFFEKDAAGRDVVRLQPLNERFEAKVVAAERVAGVYRAVWVSRAVGLPAAG